MYNHNPLGYSTDIPLCKALSLVWRLVERTSDSLLPAMSAGTEERSAAPSYRRSMLNITHCNVSDTRNCILLIQPSN